MTSFFYSAFLNIHRSGVLTALTWLVPHETAAVSAQVLCTPYNHAPCQFMQSHIHKVHACLGVTCHLHFWQNGRDLLRATAVTWRRKGYRYKSHHRTLTLEKNIVPPLLQTRTGSGGGQTETPGGREGKRVCLSPQELGEGKGCVCHPRR